MKEGFHLIAERGISRAGVMGYGSLEFQSGLKEKSFNVRKER